MHPDDDAPPAPDPAEPWPELLPEARHAPPSDVPPAPPAEPHVEAILQQIRSGVRQRTAETGAGGAAGSEAARQGLLALRQREFVAEPVPFSQRASLGRAIVLVRKAVYHLFLKWLTRPVLEQQNGFNQAVARLLQGLIETAERDDRERRELAGRVAELERRLAAEGERTSPDPR
jgi:hypothetical protein